MIAKNMLQKMYVQERKSVSVIAKQIGCSEQKINYWLAKHGISKRTISEALYTKWNPKGDPFNVRAPRTQAEAMLLGLGIGLYWGEGTKKNKHAVRLGNSDPRLIKTFVHFLRKLYGIQDHRLRFGLQIFGDMNVEDTLRFWITYLGVPRKQFFPRVVITPHRGVGNYREKTKYGVCTVYFNNKKLRDTICSAIEQVSIG